MAIRAYSLKDKPVRIGANYTVGELWLNPSHKQILLNDDLITALDPIIEHYGKRPIFPTRNSIYAETGHAAHSQHYKGNAADIIIEGVTPLDLAQFAEILGMGGIGFYKDSTKHIHIDVRRAKARWWMRTSDSRTPGFGGVSVVFALTHRSPAIREIQSALNARGERLLIDGVYGHNTAEAVKRFQRYARIPQDGRYGPGTNEKLGVFDW